MGDGHAGKGPRSIAFRDWQHPIQVATDIDQLIRTVRLYLACWSPEELALLPADLGATALTGRDAIVTRALLASRAELAFAGEPATHRLLLEMTLTLGAAAARLRTLEAYRSLV